MIRIDSIEPTVFFVRAGDVLQQVVDLAVVNGDAESQATLLVRFDGQETAIPLGPIASGRSEIKVHVPDIRQQTTVWFGLSVSGNVESEMTLDWQPQKHWEVYAVHASHHDLGYTDLPSNLLREHDGFLDDVLRYCEETADWPDDSKFRYTVEQGWSVLHYVENRPAETIDRLVRLMHEGRVEVTALFGNETSELCGHEEQIRLVYPSFRLKRRFGIPIRTAELNDVPGLSWGLVSVLSGSGIRYFSPGLPDYFAWGSEKVHPFWDEQAVLPRDMNGAFWWEGPDGSRILFWYGGYGSGGLWTYEQTVRDLPARLASMAQRGYPHDVVRFQFQGGHRDNSPPDMRLSMIAREWNSRWAYPKLIVATNTGFFERLDHVAGDGLRVLRGDLPNTDYTVGAASTAKETGVNRLAHDVLTSAEKFAMCASLASDYVYPADTLAEAYDCTLLYDEHTWGMAAAAGPAQDSCWSQKSEFAYRAAALAHDVLVKSTNRIADQINLPDEGYHITVYNALAHVRTDLVSVPAIMPNPCGRPMYWRYPAPDTQGPPIWVSGTASGRDLISLPFSLLNEPFELIDLSTGQSVPYQVTVLDDPLAAQPLAANRYARGAEDSSQSDGLRVGPAHRQTLVFVAQDVPSLGYKTYRIVPAKQKPCFESSLQVGEHVLENRFYKVTLDPESSAIVSIFDKESKREWVDSQAPHGFNQLVVRSPETGKESVPARSVVERGEIGPVFGSLIVRGETASPLLGCPQRTQEIALYDGIKRIDFANRLLKDATPLLEVYFAFPFAADKPQFRYEASNSVIEPIRDQLPGSNTDAYAMQHWVSMWDSGGGITWSSLEAPVMEVGGLWPGYVSQAHHGVTPPGYGHEFLRDPAQLDKGHIYSYAMVSNFRTNFQPVQVGDVLFRYSMTSHEGAWHPGRGRNFGWGASTFLVPVITVGGQQGTLPVSSSFCQVDQPNVLVLAMKGAEDGDGLVVRLAETEGQDTVVTVALPYFDLDQAMGTNLVEENQTILEHSRHSVQVPIRANGIATVRCLGARRWPQANSVAYF